MAKSRRSRYRGSKTKKKVKSVKTSRERSRRYRGPAAKRPRRARESFEWYGILRIKFNHGHRWTSFRLDWYLCDDENAHAAGTPKDVLRGLLRRHALQPSVPDTFFTEENHLTVDKVEYNSMDNQDIQVVLTTSRDSKPKANVALTFNPNFSPQLYEPFEPRAVVTLKLIEPIIGWLLDDEGDPFSPPPEDCPPQRRPCPDEDEDCPPQFSVL